MEQNIEKRLGEYLNSLLDEAQYFKRKGNRPASQLIISIVSDIQGILLGERPYEEYKKNNGFTT